LKLNVEINYNSVIQLISNKISENTYRKIITLSKNTYRKISLFAENTYRIGFISELAASKNR